MRHTKLVITFLGAATFALGCTSTEGPAEPKPSAGVAAQRDKVKVETKEAARAMQDYAYARKTELVDKMNRELLQIRQELDRLSAQVDRSRAAQKADAKAKLEAVREKWVEAKRHLDQSASASESNWERVKAGFERANGELKDSFAKTRQWLSDKVEP